MLLYTSFAVAHNYLPEAKYLCYLYFHNHLTFFGDVADKREKAGIELEITLLARIAGDP